jgi:hypothetical protein
MYRKSVGECTCTREQSPPPVGDGVILNEAALSGEGKDLARRPRNSPREILPRLNCAGLQDEAFERCR